MDELLKNNTYHVLELFIQFPSKDYSIRGIARELHLSHATILKYVADLEKLNLIKKKETTLYPTYYANTESTNYKFYKENWLIFQITESKVIDYIQNEIYPSSIILFGSGAKGTFTEQSDIDIFVEAKQANIDITKYEKKLNKKINLLFESNINNLGKELRNNIINGVILSGFIKIN